MTLLAAVLYLLGAVLAFACVVDFERAFGMEPRPSIRLTIVALWPLFATWVLFMMAIDYLEERDGNQHP